MTLALAFAAIAIIATAYIFITAPMGWEDEDGFHYGYGETGFRGRK